MVRRHHQANEFATSRLECQTEEPAMWTNVVPCDQPAVQGNDWVDSNGNNGNSTFRRWSNHSWVVEDFFRKSCLLEKNDPLQGNFPNFVPKGFTTSWIHVLCANFVKLFGRPEVSEIVYCLPDKKKQNFSSLSQSHLRRSCPKSARASGKQCTQSAPNFIQIGSLSAEI